MPQSAPPTAPPPARIVVVDDSPDTAEALVRHLLLEGYDASAINDPQEALQALMASPPDLILLDVMMPRISGLDVLRELRAHPPTAEIPVIMLTALGETHDMVKGFELGATDYMVKPPELEVLIARVRTHIHLKQLRDQRQRDLIELRELNALKDKFLQIAAHDLRGPLGNILMGLELLTMVVGEKAPEMASVVQTMRSAAETMRMLVNDFLDLQAIRAGKIELDVGKVALNTLVENVLAQHRPAAEAKRISLRAQLDPALPHTQADPDRIAQVVANFISNAIKFSPPGAAVGVRTLVREGRIVVEVADTGPGIPEDEMPQLFQEFARLSNRPTGGEQSTGFGLAIARQLIELHGGQIGAKSKVGQGSLFWFALPVKAAVSEQPPSGEKM